MWFFRISQQKSTIPFFGRDFHSRNPDWDPKFDTVYQSPDFPYVFLGGQDDLPQASREAGGEITRQFDLRSLGELTAIDRTWSSSEPASTQDAFNLKVDELKELITSDSSPLYVFCEGGANRSVSVLASAISELTNRPLIDILDEMKHARAVVNPDDRNYYFATDRASKDENQLWNQMNQDFPPVQEIPTNVAHSESLNLPDDLSNDINILHEEKQWRQSITTRGSLVQHDSGKIGKVVKLIGDPVNGGKVIVNFEGFTVEVSALELSPVMKAVSPFREASTNWLQKISQAKIWAPGEFAILSVHGSQKFAVVRIIGHQISEEVPYQVFDFFSKDGVPIDDNGSPANHYHAPGRDGNVHPSNLYNTLSDLIRRMSPDSLMDVLNEPHIHEFIEKYPNLRGDIETASDAVDYQEFDVMGMSVQLFNDTERAKGNPGIMKTRGTEGMYYWRIPELQTTSIDPKDGIDLAPWGTGRFPTLQRAMESAEKYVDYLLYGGTG